MPAGRTFIASLPLLALLAMASLWPTDASAQSPERPRPSQDWRSRRDQATQNTLSDAVRRVERDTGGEVLSAERVQYDGRDMHRVKVVDDQGRVRIFMQDPNRPPRDQTQRASEDGEGPGQRPPTRGQND